MASPDRHRDRWIVRASLAGLVAVLCFLAAFSVVTERGVAAKSALAARAPRLACSPAAFSVVTGRGVAAKSALADRATRLSATYQDARLWVSDEKSIERQYR